MDSPKCETSSPPPPTTSSRPAWKKIPTGNPIPVMGDESWPSLPGSINEEPPSSLSSQSASYVSDSDQCQKVELLTVSSPVVSDLAKTVPPISSVPDSNLDDERGDLGCPLKSPPNPSPDNGARNHNSKPQFRQNSRGNRFQNKSSMNRRHHHQGGSNPWNGNGGMRPFNRYPNHPHGLMNGHGSFLLPPPPPPPPLYIPPSTLQYIPDYGEYYGPYYQDAYTPLHHATYHAPEIMNGVSMYLQPLSSPTIEVYMQQDLVELCNALRKQIEYYFSYENLVKDSYLRSKMDEEGWVSINLIAGFYRVKAITQDEYLIPEALRSSTIVEVQGDKIRRRGDWMLWVLPHGASKIEAVTF